MFLPNLNEFINPKHELCRLARKIDWDSFENEFAPLYSLIGSPAKPVRLMVGLLMLKQIYDLSDEAVTGEWTVNPYFQYFCGEAVFQWEPPCDPSDLVHFRHRIGGEWVEQIIALGKLVSEEDLPENDFPSALPEPGLTDLPDIRPHTKLIEKWRRFRERLKNR